VGINEAGQSFIRPTNKSDLPMRFIEEPMNHYAVRVVAAKTMELVCGERIEI